MLTDAEYNSSLLQQLQRYAFNLKGLFYIKLSL